METYPIPMVPGPVRVPQAVLQAYAKDYGSGDLESEFLELYNRCEADLQQILATRSKVVIMTGEGMLALWGALKSCLRPGERVLSIATGVFGYGIGDLARSIGAEVRTLGLGYDETVSDWAAVEQAIIEFKPKMITIVHCETPSGTLNPLAELGQLEAQTQRAACCTWTRSPAWAARRCWWTSGASTCSWAARRRRSRSRRRCRLWRSARLPGR